ncbi:MAG: hypothetical protein ACOYD1_07580 [Candidatus Nanopelagicales bacterium]
MSVIKKVSQDKVPRGRGVNPFSEPVTKIAEKLVGAPGEWWIIGTGDHESRSRLNNAAALLAHGKYKALQDYYALGHFETRVSGAKTAPHADQFPVAVYGRFVPR